ncbi:hypothetical protein RhiirC2_788939 [Rhizophagus irregularis]|uniref:DUF8211 domain-containing protein n=2 Tax=Rhizophagus irregularis TaxID=588596 RepID=A0A2N1MP69_9GLOM|nr:hypothetical protein RhiirC2_788939 [Rhizophagus irregularis]
MYSKRIENLRPFPSKNPKTALKQQARFQRACRRIFTTKTISTSNIIKKPLKHLQYRVKPTLPIGQHYLYRTPVHLISPPEKEKSTPPPHSQADILTKENLIVTGTPAFLQKPIQLRQAHDKAGWKTPSNKKTYYVAPPPSSTIKNTSVSLTPGSSAFVNRLRDLKYNHEKAERAKTRKFNIRNIIAKITDIGSTSENPPKLTLRKALLAKMFRDFNIPYSSVIDVNQPHYDTDIDAYSPGRINYKRLPELHSSLKRKTPCPEDDFASDT